MYALAIRDDESGGPSSRCGDGRAGHHSGENALLVRGGRETIIEVIISALHSRILSTPVLPRKSPYQGTKWTYSFPHIGHKFKNDT